LSRRHAAALVCLVSCRGLLEIPDDPRVDPDSREEHYRHERHGQDQDQPDAPQVDAGRSVARPPAITPVSSPGVGVMPSTDAEAPTASPAPPSAGNGSADVDAGVEAAADAASSRSPFIVAGSRGIPLR
jgi:hypothetical protein